MAVNKYVSTVCAVACMAILLLAAFHWQHWQVAERGESMERHPYPVPKGITTLDLESNDVIVFLHIQKTGGSTFGVHLVKNLMHDPPCECKTPPLSMKSCKCVTKNGKTWLFSRYSTGWPCGMHADWTMLKPCVNHAMDRLEGKGRQRRYHYITMLREPVTRYISEWKHVQRGATWKPVVLVCGGRRASLKEVPFCYNGSDWSRVSLSEFLGCDYNLAHNRQSRMLANLSLVGCYSTFGHRNSSRDRILLESAKTNLHQMEYFGLTEFQEYSQLLFEYTFDMKFTKDFNITVNKYAGNANISEQEENAIKQRNAIDIELYNFAKEIFFQRVRQMEKAMRM